MHSAESRMLHYSFPVPNEGGRRYVSSSLSIMNISGMISRHDRNLGCCPPPTNGTSSLVLVNADIRVGARLPGNCNESSSEWAIDESDDNNSTFAFTYCIRQQGCTRMRRCRSQGKWRYPTTIRAYFGSCQRFLASTYVVQGRRL
jgi:hypothetical protein